jgi:glycyl-tRNA synthetase
MVPMATAKLDMEKLVSLCRRRGFIFQSSEIYGGINGFWDYGPLGVELKRNIKDAWWQDMVRNPPPGPDGQEISMVGLDCSIIMNPKVWEASGHVGGFSDPMVDCKACKSRFRADHLRALRFEQAFPSEGQKSDFPQSFVIFGYGTPEEVLEKNRKKIDKLQKAHSGGWSNYPWVTAVECKPEELAKFECPECGEVGKLTEPRAFNLMLPTHIGALQDAASLAYLRPETAQGIFVNFKNVLDSSRVKLPFGIAQIGKAFRNEINPRNYTFRSREFEQMEIEFFCHPNESRRWYEYWRDVRRNWYSTLGIKSDNLRPREQGKDELAHYSVGTTDIEYMFPFSDEPQELEGVAHRGAFDLTAHMNKSGVDLRYMDEDTWNRDAANRKTNSFKEWLKSNPPKEEIEKYQFVPHVIEPSAGADRFTLAVLCEAYTEDKQPDAKGNLEERLVMKFHPRLAPVKAAVFPLVKKDGMPEKAQALYRELKKHFKVEYDDAGAVGRRYRRQDEIGTPFCITIDGETLQNDTVTIRDRDTLKQERVPAKDVIERIRKALE